VDNTRPISHSGRAALMPKTETMVGNCNQDALFWRLMSSLVSVERKIEQIAPNREIFPISGFAPPLQSWRTILRNHTEQLNAAEFFTLRFLRYGTFSNFASCSAVGNFET
jgi:hypothetical protein